MSTDNVAGELVQLNETLQDIGDHLESIAQSLRWLYEDTRPEPQAEADSPECPECEPCIDMDHQKGYE